MLTAQTSRVGAGAPKATGVASAAERINTDRILGKEETLIPAGAIKRSSAVKSSRNWSPGESDRNVTARFMDPNALLTLSFERGLVRSVPRLTL